MRLIPALLALALAGPALAQDAATDQAIRNALGGDPAAYRTVFDGFQAAVAQGDAKAVAGFVDFPIEAKVKGRRHTVADAAAFETDYAAIVTPKVAEAVAAARWDDLFVNYQGVMLGNGEVWINGVCRDSGCAEADVRVVTIQPGS